MIIGFAGQAGAGKDFAATLLEDMLAGTVKQYKFAEPLKQFCRTAFGWTEDHTDGDLKEIKNDNGITPRQAMQWLGTEWGRKVDPDVWTNCLRRHVERDMSETVMVQPPSGRFNSSHTPYKVDHAIITDVRFPNEVATIHAMGGIVVRLIGGFSSTVFANHASEATDISALVDYEVDNEAIMGVRNPGPLKEALATVLFDIANPQEEAVVEKVAGLNSRPGVGFVDWTRR